MRHHRTNNMNVMIGALLVIATLLAVGCSQQSPMSSNDESSQPRLLSRSMSSGAASLSPAELYTEARVSSAEGGVLSLIDVVLEVPAGAVPNDTLFSIAIPDPNVFFNEFGTHGLVFDVPVTVTMSYRDADLSGIDESTIRLGWFDPDTGEMHDMVCEVDYVTKTVTGQLNHFSAYGLISD